ncbi:MAG: ArsA family ATPase [Actinomycetota bacterium]|nr:ArsA family ATPase [Actinomycetota bacterium]
MLIDEFLAPKTLIVSGKGGVGKTTVASALALVAARQGRKVCVAEVDQKGTLPKLFSRGPLGYQPSELAPGLWGMNINPEEALVEYLDVQYHMRRVAKIFTSTHFLDYITTAAPGLKDILVLGKIWYLEQGRVTPGKHHDFDTIVVDAPAAGHMLSFLAAPMGLSDALRMGPVRRQADWLNEMLKDPKRSRVHLVTLPEEMPVSETLETAAALESRLGIGAGVVFANAVYANPFSADEEDDIVRLLADGKADELSAAATGANVRLDAEDLEALTGYARFLTARRSIQGTHLRKLRKGIAEPVVELPFLFNAGLTLPDVETLSDVIEEQVEAL